MVRSDVKTRAGAENLLVLAGLLAQAATLEPIERYAAWRGSNGIEAEFNVESQEEVKTASGTYRAGSNRSQLFAMTSDGTTERLMQSGSTTLYEFTSEGQYIEANNPHRMAGPPSEAHLAAQLFFPVFLQRPDLKWLLNEKGWTAQAAETIDGTLCDVMLGSNAPEAEPGMIVQGHMDHRVWIDPIGRILRWEYTNNSPRGKRTTTFKFSKMGLTDWSLKELPPPKEGTVPLFLPRRGDGIELGSSPELTTWWDDAGKAVEPKDLAGQNGMLVLLTRPDCEPSSAGMKLWAQVEAEARKAGLGFAEVSLSEVKQVAKPPWKRFWDTQGEVANQVSPPGTPYLLRIDKKGMAVRAWYGFTAGEEQEILDALFK